MLTLQATALASVPAGPRRQPNDDQAYADMMSLQLPSSLELGSALRHGLPSDLDLNAADHHVCDLRPCRLLPRLINLPSHSPSLEAH